MATIRRINSGSGTPYDDDQDPRSSGNPPRMPVPQAPAPAGPPEPEGVPNPGDVNAGPGARQGETPRERSEAGGAGAVPSRPQSPTPVAGTPQPPVIGPPLPSPGPGSLAKPAALRSLFGGQGGLTGGGLGLPLDPTSNQSSDPISTLMQLLKQGGSGGGGGYF